MWNSVEIIKHCQPKFVLWENVKNVLSKRHKHNFDKYLDRMNELGYNNYYKVLNAKDYGIPQNRERTYVLSIRKDIDTGFEFPEPIELKLRLKDMLDDEVDEKYYLNAERFVSGYLGNAVKPDSPDCEQRRKQKIMPEVGGAVSTRVNRFVDCSNYITDSRKEITVGEYLEKCNKANILEDVNGKIRVKQTTDNN